MEQLILSYESILNDKEMKAIHLRYQGKNFAEIAQETGFAHSYVRKLFMRKGKLGVTKNTLYSWVSQKRIPYVKIGRLVKFDRDDIDAWVERQKVKPYSG